jgi:glycosyltransferase involved in cell wall biosynthesis
VLKQQNNQFCPAESMKRILVVTETGDAWPSGRIRALIYRDLFACDGIDVHYVSRLVPWLSRLGTHPNRTLGYAMKMGLDRILRNLNHLLAFAKEAEIYRIARHYDIIYLQKVASLRLVSRLRRATSARLVYDLNDGVWLPSRSWFAGGKIRDILGRVDAVTCDNRFGLQFAHQYNPQTYLVPDPPQLELFDLYRQQVARNSLQVVLGWIGSPATLFNLYSIWEPLEVLFSRFENITLRLLGVGHGKRLLPPFEKVRYTSLPYYTQEQMVCEVLQMDIGLFPLFDVEDSYVRGILKAAIYMSGEACVITRPIGGNSELIKDFQNGVFAQTLQEWLDRLSVLVENQSLRRKIASAGLQTVREGYTLRHCYEKLMYALRGDET